MKLVQLPPAVDIMRLTHGFHNDFDQDQDTAEIVITATDSGTGSVGDAVGGVLALVASDGTVADNDECYAESPNETFKFADGKPLRFGARVQFTEANTDDANVIVGIKDAVAADTLQDNGAGPPASYSGAVFYKVDGGTKWVFETSNGATQTTNTTDVTAGGSSYQVLEIEVQELDSLSCRIVPLIDGKQCRDNTTGDLIAHTVLYASATEMQACLGVKNGDTNVETLNCDWWYCYQKR